jgi:hypothetical protein
MTLTTVNAGMLDTQAQYNGFKNRLINSAMVIDQRNAGASVTVNTGAAFFAADRFRFSGVSSSGVFTIQQVSDAPAGFVKSTKATVTTADATLTGSDLYYALHNIEGFNIADLAWGSASASAVTLSFWIKSSVTGTFGGALSNNAVDRSYPFTYTINAANTFEYKTITIAGDTSGTWLTDNSTGIRVYFGLGIASGFAGTAGAWAAAQYLSATGSVNLMATNAATWQITGVQLEKGSTATSFDYRPYGTELALCQRYLPAFVATAINATLPFVGCGVNSTTQAGTYTFEVATRTPPTGITVSSASHFTSSRPSTGNTVVTAVNFAASSCYACQVEIKAASGLTADVPYLLYANSASGVMLFTGCEL